MRILAFILITATGFAQNLTEFGAVAAGSAVGGASGKSVSDGLTAILGKVDQQAAAAAAIDARKERQRESAEFKAAPGIPLSESGGVPLPPPLASRHAAPAPQIAQPTAPLVATQFLTLAQVTPALPPPPVMSPETFHGISNGMPRADVLRLGLPSSRITMFEDGHLVEVYSYHQNGQKFGSLQLTDGAVSRVQ